MKEVINYQFPHPYLLNGPHNPMFFKNVDLIESTIKNMKLAPMSGTIKQKAEAREIAEYPWWWKYGGIRVAHLHYNGDVYLLNNEQWRAFSKSLIKVMATQIEHANTVSFENALSAYNELENFI